MSSQTKNNNSNCLIDPTFTNVNRLVVLTFEDEDEDDKLLLQNIMYQKLTKRL